MNGDTHNDREALERLLHAHGVAAHYIDFVGNVVEIPLENRLRVLREMGVDLPPDNDVGAYVQEQDDRRRQRLLPDVMLLGIGSDHVPLQNVAPVAGREVRWTLRGETGDTVGGTFVPGEEDGCRAIAVPALAMGYYRLHIDAGPESASTFIIVAPERAFEPAFRREGRRLWGISAQLFALGSARNWGIGDFTDLENLVTEVAARGGDFILLNPLHALDIQAPENASPYSPTDRRFLNPLYIDPAATAEYGHETVQAWLREQNMAQRVAPLRESGQVLYAQTQTLKYTLYDRLYRQFREHADGDRDAAFRAFVDSGGAGLQRFARYQAGRDIGAIPSAGDPGFHLYLQWLAAAQLDRVQALAMDKGMHLGLVRDLAVGATDDSFEVLDNPGLFCRSARIGAPPDHFNPQGQNWGLTPITPRALEDSGFDHFIQLLRTNMRACGALRLDHIMALMRLWWCPVDGPNAAGAYVHYNTDALFAILRLESARAGCMIIGEDLGVVPPEIRGYIADSAILSNTIFYFEKYDGVSFRKPEHYNPQALAIITNHDVPTLKAWWNTSDLALRRRIGMIENDEALRQESEARARDKQGLLQMLADVHLIPGDWLDRNIDRPFDLSLCTAIIRACARSTSALVSIQLDDLAGLETPINIPGTNQEYGNWRRKVPGPLHELFARDEVAAMLAPLQEERPRC